MKEGKMVLIPVLCPHGHSNQVLKGGKTKAGKQRYTCQNVNCGRYSLQLELTYKGLSPEVKEQSVDRALSGSGIRDSVCIWSTGLDSKGANLKHHPLSIGA
jgi:transposase-like protein